MKVQAQNLTSAQRRHHDIRLQTWLSTASARHIQCEINQPVEIKHKCYYNQQLLLAGRIIKCAGFASISDVPTKIASWYNFFAISRQIRVCTTCDQFWKVLLQTNPYLLNKWPLKFACAYLNTQESSPSGTPLKRLQDVRYSMKLSSLLQYFFVLGKSIFLHFLSNWNKFIDIVSGRFEFRQVSLPSLTSPLKSHHCTTFLQYLGKYAFVRRETSKFWKVLLQTNPYLLNKWPLKFACAYLNTQESSPSGTPLKRLQDG
ncbi:hypothetical protein T12_6260 [Trichinella patagoniensis]|uniref:Uncharacterized protein n=1 Tax=Trichinella patagoniensis TaxID=990121 RepID=A0A0V1A725_9BILA|nr:hypothetical protein T12_6260 [Trichinella patagoniensis]